MRASESRSLAEPPREWPIGVGKLGSRYDHRSGERDEHVDSAGDQEPREERERKGPPGILRLLSDVRRVLEADERIERKRRPGQHSEHGAFAVLELEVPPEVGVAVPESPRADGDNDREPAQLDERQDDVRLHRLDDPTEVDGRDDDDERERRGRGRDACEHL